MSIVKINGKPYKFTEHENELIKKNGLTLGMVAKRVRGGWALLEALDAPYGMHLKEYREMKQMEKIKQARLERELERERKKEAELKRKKPHLFNVPQKHSRDPYWFDNTYNQMFKKWQEA
ncbi:TPA: SA1788 family PVL leukocidin-associated protein [Staphylococcus aureus]